MDYSGWTNYGSKALIASTAKGNLIVGVVSHEQNLHGYFFSVLNLLQMEFQLQNAFGKSLHCQPTHLVQHSS
jgi:hypothetical protein